MTATQKAPEFQAAGEFGYFLAEIGFGVGPAVSAPVYQGSVLTQCFAAGRLELCTDAAAGPFGQVRLSDLGAMLLAASALPDEVLAAGLTPPDPIPNRGVDRQLAGFFYANGGLKRFGAPLASGFDHAGARCQLFAKAVLRGTGSGQAVADPLGSLFMGLQRTLRQRVDPLPAPGEPPDPEAGIDAPIIYYHEVPDPDAFASQLEGLVGLGFRVVPYERLVRALRGTADLPDKPLVITFDDGRKSQLHNAAPVLLRLRLPATFFVLPGFDLLEPGHLSADAFARLRSWGFSVQSHTLNHADMPSLLRRDRGAAEAEVVHSRDALLPIGGGNHFSYPFGGYDQATADLVRAAGYESAVSTRFDRVHYPDDLYRLARIQANPQASHLQVSADLDSAARYELAVDPT
jgi:peptidoglycan/xylan/chitin deacetylase (PgdA/CDA1 family)